MSKLPAFQFYPADWLKDPAVRAIGFHDKGVWFDMLCLMHEMESRGFLKINGQKIDEKTLSAMIGLDKQKLSKSLANMRKFNVFSEAEDGTIFSRRMVHDEAIRQIRKAAGSKGGNPLLNQKAKQKPTPSSSSSSSSSTTVKKKVQKKPEKTDLMIRIEGWFNRTLTRRWDEKEIKALQSRGIDISADADIDLMEKYYTSDHKYLRKDMVTMLNNWGGELDRAAKWLNESGATANPVDNILAYKYHEALKAELCQTLEQGKFEEYCQDKSKIPGWMMDNIKAAQ